MTEESGAPITSYFEGLDELIARLDDPRVLDASRRRMEAAALIIEAGARDKSPVFMGLLRSSWTHQVEALAGEVKGIVGNPVHYAPMQEFGTGLLCDGPGGTGSAHYPPAAALGRWAELHGMAGMEYAIARAIGARGGLEPKRMLRDSLEQNRGAAQDQLEKVLDDVAALLAGSAT